MLLDRQALSYVKSHMVDIWATRLGLCRGPYSFSGIGRRVCGVQSQCCGQAPLRDSTGWASKMCNYATEESASSRGVPSAPSNGPAYGQHDLQYFAAGDSIARRPDRIAGGKQDLHSRWSLVDRSHAGIMTIGRRSRVSEEACTGIPGYRWAGLMGLSVR